MDLIRMRRVETETALKTNNLMICSSGFNRTSRDLIRFYIIIICFFLSTLNSEKPDL